MNTPKPLPLSAGRYQILSLPLHNRRETLSLDKCARKSCDHPRRIDSIYCIDHQNPKIITKTHDNTPAISD
jgi:hypothetical protein